MSADHDGHLDSVEQRGRPVVVAFSWSDSSDTRHDWARVLELKEGKIISMHDYATPWRSDARDAATRRTQLLARPLR